MGLLYRPRTYHTDRPSTSTERARACRQRQRDELDMLREKDTIRAYHKATKTEVATPWPVFYEYDAEFHFTLDVCATADNTKCARYLSPEQDGLVQDWGHDVCWLNPPYGRGMDAWMAKAYHSSLAGATVLALVPARTGTRWWHAWVMGKGEIRERQGRVTFVGEVNPAGFDSIAVIYRPCLVSEVLPRAWT